jgi:predicted lipase
MVDYKLALLCARLSQEVYLDFKSIKFDSMPGVSVQTIESKDAGQTDTQAAILINTDTQDLYIVFRGTEKGIDWINNFQIRQQIYPYGDESSTDVRFHRGFMLAYFAVRDRLLEAVRDLPNYTITTTGHSLGGALATIAALDVQYNITQHTGQAIRAYTFGAPRVGNSALVNSFRQRVPDSHRFVYGWDIVTRVPRLWQGFEHVPELYQLGGLWTWQVVSRRFTDHDIENYILALQAKL